jgi:hypothetical protein
MRAGARSQQGGAVVLKLALSLGILGSLVFIPSTAAQDCVDCHRRVTPTIVQDWANSLHSENGVDCSVCHGDGHRSAEDVDKVQIPTPQTCAECHETQVEQFSRGKHALAWAAMNAMPTTHMMPMALTQGMKGCGGCHKIGLKSPDEIRQLSEEGGGFGLASCDACHTRHLFSIREAKDPEACRSCHMGFDHAQWEMYSGSKHGVRNSLKRDGVIPETAAAPTCQDCHMQGGDHEVMTSWGFLAVRLPLPEDEEWKQNQVTILQGLGVLDPEGNPTPRLEVVKAAKVARLTEEAWVEERERMIGVCGRCHSTNFARRQLQAGDDMIKNADALMAEAIRIVAGLYQDKVLEQPSSYPYAFPDLLTFHDATSVIEQKLFVMFLEHRMRAFQGSFHNNPDYALWYGWSELVRDVAEIRELAAEMRRDAAKGEE